VTTYFSEVCAPSQTTCYYSADQVDRKTSRLEHGEDGICKEVSDAQSRTASED
jgi:hypothetical protein